jgi:NDP-sugar pyrophosphorylase family protein
MYGMDLAFQNAIDAKEKVFGYVTDGEFIDIGDKESYDEANKFFTGKLGKIL